MKKMLLAGLALGLGSPSRARRSAQIKIGVAGPITGPNAAFGAQLKNGVEQAVEDIKQPAASTARSCSSSSATTSPIPSRASRSPTSSPPKA